MPDYGTIYCSKLAPGAALQILEEFFPGKVTQPTDSADSMVVAEGDVGSIQITTRQFQTVGDPFSQLRYDSVQFVLNRCEGEQDDLEALADKLAESPQILGCVITPDFEADERYNDVIVTLAQELDGIIFNGTDFFSSDGDVLASIEGAE